MDLSALSSDLPSTKAVSEASVKELTRELTTEFKNAAKAVAGLYSVAATASNATSTGGSGTPKTAKTAAALKQDFSETAKSVASLYRLANTSTALFRLKGYMDCLDDILEVIEQGQDIENWVLTRKAEISNLHKTDSAVVNSTSRTSEPTLLLSDNESHSSSSIAVSNCNNNSQNMISGMPLADAAEDFSIPSDFEFRMPDSLAVSHHFRLSHPPLSVQHSRKQILQHKMQLNDFGKKRRPFRVANQVSEEEDDNVSEDLSNSEEENKKAPATEGEEPRKRRRFNEGLNQTPKSGQ